MDSITQIVLGAACGEAVLGKKLGNKALLYGAIGGTIPDLDVFLGDFLFSNEIQSMAFHRGIMHSIFFAVFASFILGHLFYFIYSRKNINNYISKIEWIRLFFLSLFTHSLLDCFTAYGTQIFSPFSNYRVAFNNISVVDPLYTVPFLISLILLMFFKRSSKLRSKLLKFGFIVSGIYLILTLINKYNVNHVFKSSLADIDYIRFRSQPTILNNILWYGIVETESDYQYAFYSILDSDKRNIKWRKISKNHELLSVKDDNIQTLIWFSDGFYSFSPTEDKNKFIFRDLRYPMMDENDPNSSIFSFIIKNDKENWNIFPSNIEKPEKNNLRNFWSRLKGI